MMPTTDSIWSIVANFGLLVLVGLGLKGRIDALDKTKVDKDTCNALENAHDNEIKAFRAEMRESRLLIERNHAAVMKLIMGIYQTMPKRTVDYSQRLKPGDS